MPKSGSQMSNVMKSMKQTSWGYTCRETNEPKRFKSKIACDMNRKLHTTNCIPCMFSDCNYPTIETKEQLQQVAKKMLMANKYEHMRVSKADLE